MATPDNVAIDNFTDSYKKQANQFSSSQMLYWSDYNNNSYNSGIIKFDSLTAKDQYWIPADSYLMLPLTIQTAAGGTAYLTGDPIAFKTSLLSLITGLQISSGSGQTLVNDQSIHYINNIRRLIDTSIDAEWTNLNELELWKDTSLPAVAGAVNASLSQWSSAPRVATNDQRPFTNDGPPPTVVANVNPVYNEGFDRRIRLFKQHATFAAGVFSLVCFIPLCYIHPFFAALDFPIINSRFQINFFTPMNNSTAAVTLNTPIIHGPFNSNNAGAPVAMTDAQMSISSTCYLYYRKVTYSPEDQAKVANLLSKGHSITFEYPTTDFYPSIAQGLAANTTRTDTVSPSTVAPLRIWQLLLPAGYVAGSLANIQQVPFVTNSYLTRGNVLINSQRYYDNDLGANGAATAQHDFFQVLSEQLVGHGYKDNLGSLIGFNDFISNYAFQVYDVSRIKDRLANPSEACNLQVVYTTAAANPVGAYTATSDSLFLVERNNVAVMRFSTGDLSIAIGSAA